MTDAIIELIRRVERLERALNRTAVGERTPGGGGGAPTDATYLVLSANGSLSGERVATEGANISLTDAGAGGALTVAVDPQGPSSGLDADTVDGVELSGLVQTSRTINTALGLLGGGNLSANRTLSLDIDGLTEEATPDGGDMLAIYDDSAAAMRKQSRNSFLSGTTAAQASEAAQGVIELATQAETDAGTDDERAVTPLKLATLISYKPPSRVSQRDNAIVAMFSMSVSDFVSTISGTPSGSTLVYGTVTSGNENVLGAISSTQLAKVVLHNTTRGTSALISSVNTGTNTITLTAAVPGGWASGDTITIRSDTNTFTVLGAYYVDFEMTDLDPSSTYFVAAFSIRDSGAAGRAGIIHPYETDSTPKRIINTVQVANVFVDFTTPKIALVENRFCMLWTASGTGTFSISFFLVEEG